MNKPFFRIFILVIFFGSILMMIFQNVAFITVEDIDHSSINNFEEVRCELALGPDSSLFVMATYDIEAYKASLVVKMLENSVLEEATLSGARTHDEDGFVNYITSDYVFRFYMEDSLGIPEAKYAILESPDESFDLGNNCFIN